MKKISVKKIIGLLNLEPHPEGGYFKETYKSLKKSRFVRFVGKRSYSTAIYFLIPSGQKSSLHRIKSDEIWHFYLGGPIAIVEINPKGKVIKTVLGSNLAKGEVLQHVVPAGVWFGAYPNFGTEYALVGCTVAPGFDFKDFELGDKRGLLKKFPNAEEEIELLT